MNATSAHLTADAVRHQAWSTAAIGRLAWTLLSCYVVQSLVIGISLLPAVAFFEWHLAWPIDSVLLRGLVLCMAIVPSYLIFATLLIVLSALSCRVLGWRTPPNAEMRIADLNWDLCDWGRYAISTHIVRVLAGSLFRSTPVWSFYLTLNGAKLGRRVWVNSLDVVDHCLLDFGDDVVVGSDVYLSGHTVENGIVKTAPVTLGAGTTVGLSSHVGIGLRTGARCRIGSLSVVPKHSVLDGDTTYVGAPVREISRREPADQVTDGDLSMYPRR